MSFEPITLERLLRVPTIYQNPKHQAKYADNRARHVAEVGELVEAVATLADGGHSLLCFSPFENGKGSYACTCSPNKFTKARAIVALVQAGSKQAVGDKYPETIRHLARMPSMTLHVRCVGCGHEWQATVPVPVPHHLECSQCEWPKRKAAEAAGSATATSPQDKA